MKPKVEECKALEVGGTGGRTCFVSCGRAVQVDLIKPTVKAPGSKRLKLEYDEPPSIFAFKFNLRRYTVAAGPGRVGGRPAVPVRPRA